MHLWQQNFDFLVPLRHEDASPQQSHLGGQVQACACVFAEMGGGIRGVGSRLSAPSLQLGEGVLPSSSLQSHYMRDQVCAVPDLCTAASAGSSGELSAFSYLPVWLTMQYMKLWSIELCYLKDWGFFPVSFCFRFCGGECLAGFSFYFFFSFLFFARRNIF